MGNTLCTAQTDSYEDYYNIFPTDSVVITIPKYANSFLKVKLIRISQMIPNSP